MQELIEPGNKVYLVTYMVIKMHSSCEELADTPGMRLSVGEAFFHSSYYLDFLI